MKTLFIIILVVSLPAASHAGINTEAIEAYFRITDSLKAKKVVSQRDWDRFFGLRGNAVFVHSAGKDSAELKERFIRNVQLVYSEAVSSDLKPARDLMLADIYFLRQHELGIRNFVRNIGHTDIVGKMYAEAYKYLPEKMRGKVEGLQVFYAAPVMPNAYARANSIYINTALEYRFITIRPGIVGSHELHHLLLRDRQFRDRTVTDGIILVAALKRTAREGIADLIDKKYLEALPDTTYSSLQQRQLALSSALISDFNKEVEKWAFLALPGRQVGSRMFKLRWGHTPGYYMARVIEKNGLLTQLIQSIDNPFQFVYIYNEAARLDPAQAPRFSDAAIRLLKDIEHRFY